MALVFVLVLRTLTVIKTTASTAPSLSSSSLVGLTLFVNGLLREEDWRLGVPLGR